MTDRSKIILVGGFAEAIELAEECGREIVGLIDPSLSREHGGYPVLGNDEDAGTIAAAYPSVPVLIAVDEPQKRMRLVESYRRAGFAFASLIHPAAKISRSARIGHGVLAQFGVHVSAGAAIGDHVRLNVYANVTHDVTVGEGTTIAPNAVILGRARIGERCYVGAHSTILVDVEVGSGATVGAHANVTRDVAPGQVVVGNPARPQPAR